MLGRRYNWICRPVVRHDLAAVLIMLTYFSVVSCHEAAAQVIRLHDFEPQKDGMPGEEHWARRIKVGPGVTFPATVNVTARRNGMLEFANLKLRILKEYDDGMVYVGGLLHVEFIDISGDGYKDLVVTGTVIHTGEKEEDPKVYETVTSIYVFDKRTRDYVLVFHVGPPLEI